MSPRIVLVGARGAAVTTAGTASIPIIRRRGRVVSRAATSSSMAVIRRRRGILPTTGAGSRLGIRRGVSWPVRDAFCLGAAMRLARLVVRSVSSAAVSSAGGVPGRVVALVARGARLSQGIRTSTIARRAARAAISSSVSLTVSVSVSVSVAVAVAIAVTITIRAPGLIVAVSSRGGAVLGGAGALAVSLRFVTARLRALAGLPVGRVAAVDIVGSVVVV